MAETIPGGVYKVGDQWQDANGKVVDAPKGKDEDAADEEPETEPARRGPGRPRGG